MPTKHGAYSADFEESKVTGLDDNAYNPGPRPNKYVSNAKGTNKIDLSKRIDNTDDGYQRDTKKLTDAGFSGPVGRNK
jgi:hypothetical protein